jgi:PhzF family phenazine biosynthesis protein
MKIPIYQVDAFTNQPFFGNPAAVCPLESWLDDQTLLNIAVENNLSETAFIVKSQEAGVDYDLRWFTPAIEVDLCGHATLASAKVIFDILEPEKRQITFSCQAGLLVVTKLVNQLVMDFPSRKPLPSGLPSGAFEAIGGNPIDILKGERDHLLVFESAKEVMDLKPNFTALKRCGLYGYIATAPAEDLDGDYDFISRCFFPAYNIDEDPVTGSAHCVSAPYWAEQLGKDKLYARQVSPRGGELWLSVENDRVKIAGEAVLVMTGELTV